MTLHIDDLRKLLIGRTVVKIEENVDGDEGVIFWFDDRSQFEVGYSGESGGMGYVDGEGKKQDVFISAYFTE